MFVKRRLLDWSLFLRCSFRSPAPQRAEETRVRDFEPYEHLRAWLETVSDPGLGNNVARRRCLWLQFLAQLANKYPQIFNLLRTLPAPDRAEQRPMSYQFSRMPRQINQKIKFLRRQADFATAEGNFMRGEINTEITNLNERRLVVLRGNAA